MSAEQDRRVTVAALRAAIPYLRLFQGKTFVVKIGGQVIEDARQAYDLMEQVGILHHLGIRVIVVHGGGAQVTGLAARFGIETRFVDGRRITDAKTRDVVAMMLSSLNTSLVATCRKLELPALGISGVDAGLVKARQREPQEIAGSAVDFGFVGDIKAVRIGVLRRILDEGFVPVVSPLSADEKGEILNVNADVMASRLAVEIKAEKIVFVTGALGILADRDDVSSLVSYTDVEGLARLRAAGALAGGMLPKVAAIEQALREGVTRAHVISHELPDSLLLEVFTNEGCGTMVVLDTGSLTPEEAPD